MCIHSSFSVKTPHTDLWHYRLGHPSDSRIKLIHQLHPHVTFDSNQCCLVFPLAKHRRLPFPVSSTSSMNVFDLIHCDLWGPFSISSLTGAKYFLTIVDDYSRFTWTHLLQAKSQTQNLFKSFLISLKLNSIRRSNVFVLIMGQNFICQNFSLQNAQSTS